MAELNPYAAPQSETLGSLPDFEMTRKAHLKMEIILRTLGATSASYGLLLLAVVARVAVRVGTLVSERQLEFLTSGPFWWGVGLLVAGLGLMMLWRWALALLAVAMAANLTFGMLSMPQGLAVMIPASLILYQLLSAKARTITSASYRHVVLQTSAFKYRLKTALLSVGLSVLLFVYGVIALSGLTAR